MNILPRTPTWVLQSNFVNDGELHRLIEAIVAVGATIEPIKIVPFSTKKLKIQADPEYPVVGYGSTTFVTSSVWKDYRPGVWANAALFKHGVWAKYLGEKLLNAEHSVLNATGVINLPGVEDLFVRPDDDSKCMNGGVYSREELRGMFSRMSDYEGWKPGQTFVVANPTRTWTEWRLFVVNLQIVAWSQYRTNGVLDTAPGCPDAVKDFVRKSMGLFYPGTCFVVDVCQIDSGLRVIEYNCINASGLYKADVLALVKALTAEASEY